MSREVSGEIQESQGGGAPLSAAARRFMESTLQADLSAVRLHEDSRADRLNRALEARAFTLGQDVFFRQGEPRPETPAGLHLLTHELVHTVQQADQAGAPRLIQRSKIDSTTTAGTKETPIAVLGKEFGRTTQVKLKTSGNNLTTLDEFNKDGGVGDTVERAQKVEATLVGKRRTAGGRQSQTPQSALGAIGDQERIIQEGGAQAGNKAYAGGHLISDKILGLDSFREDNLAAQLIDFNSPAYRNLEVIAEGGLLDSTGKKDLQAPISATVELAYPSGDISITDTELQNRGILPSTITPTGKTLTISHWVPKSWKLSLEFDDTKFPNHRFPPKDLGPASAASFVPSSSAFGPSSATGFQFNIDPFTQIGSQFRFGGPGSGNKLTLTAQQDIPQPSSASGGTTATASTTPTTASTTPTTSSGGGGFTIPSIFSSPFKVNNFDETSPDFDLIKNTFTQTFATDLVKTVKKRKTLSGTVATKEELATTFTTVSKSKPNKVRMKEFKDDPNLDFT